MKKFLSLLAISMIFISSNSMWILQLSNAKQNNDKQETKITICHEDKTLEISEKALESHLDHWDTLWECETSSENSSQPSPSKEKEQEDELVNSSNWKCIWVDQNWRSRKDWHKDMLEWEDITLYKKCDEMKWNKIWFIK